MHNVIFRVRSTDGHGQWQGAFKEVVETLPEVGSHANIWLPYETKNEEKNIKTLRVNERAGLIVEAITPDVILDEKEIMASFHGAIIDCRWA